MHCFLTKNDTLIEQRDFCILLFESCFLICYIAKWYINIFIFIRKAQYSIVKQDITHFCYSFYSTLLYSTSILLHQTRPFCTITPIRTHTTLSICTAPQPMGLHHTRIPKNNRQRIMNRRSWGKIDLWLILSANSKYPLHHTFQNSLLFCRSFLAQLLHSKE